MRSINTDECCLYSGYTNQEDYGKRTYWVYEPIRRQKNVYMHRAMYEASFGPLEHGEVLDHLCRTPRCINVDHLEPVTVKENVRRGRAVTTHCSKGHAYTDDNTHYTPHKNGYMTKKCRECFRRIHRR